MKACSLSQQHRALPMTSAG